MVPFPIGLGGVFNARIGHCVSLSLVVDSSEGEGNSGEAVVRCLLGSLADSEGEDGVEDIQRFFSIFSQSDIAFVMDVLSIFISVCAVKSSMALL